MCFFSACMSLIVFSHANGFPAGTYTQLFGHLRSRGFLVRALDKFGHDPRFPVHDNWSELVEQLFEFTKNEVGKAGEPAFLVGHSLGGFLSLMCAARHPDMARGVLLLDAPVLGGWRAKAVWAMKRTPLMGALSPGSISRQRRNRWPSRQAVVEHLRQRQVFQKWDDQVLLDYVTHGTHDDDGDRVLRFEREIETAIYNTLPDHLPRLLRQHPLQCPAAFIGGLQSAQLRQAGLAMTQKVTHGRMTMLDGGHLFPMEKPLATAAAIEASLLALGV